MAVNVQQREPDETTGSTDVYVEQGEHFVVHEGVLTVLDGLNGRQVAVFTPGTWLSAQVED